MSPAEMPACRELDALVALKVMGFWFADDQWWGKHPSTPGARAYASACTSPRLRGGSYRETDGLPRFSDDLVAAWTVHLTMCDRLFSTRIRYLDALREESRSPEGWLPDGLHALVVLRDRFPLAICRAALTALAPFDTLAAVREAETECHAEERDA
jgi:hypothetical protein